MDKLEVARFIYLLLTNKRVRDVLDTVTSKVVLINTTIIYTHVLNKGGRGVRSPADRLWDQ